MLARLLTQPILATHPAVLRREPVVLPFSRRKLAKPAPDWSEKYPCTRMHGAAFESEFYPASGGAF